MKGFWGALLLVLMFSQVGCRREPVVAPCYPMYYCQPCPQTYMPRACAPVAATPCMPAPTTYAPSAAPYTLGPASTAPASSPASAPPSLPSGPRS